MSINCFNPTSTSGSDGYINYKMSGGGGGGNNNGSGCGSFLGIFIVLFVLMLVGKLA